ncbi:conserved Plasmodium protein, unknown function [Plasmodium vivax]|uniref:(malaria parasite P. vivax) hypothetical protein n=1 Tax=Plasmodium vivax TaxID=5855 RepID=A0A1G4HIU3_PLAVI|nr:unnamed protein product [Plasmodium vivax]SCO74836.1 conserved Plasmodium protein, unknown function [Plasmodium vivax]
MEESLFINLEGKDHLLELIKKYEERVKRGQPANVVLPGGGRKNSFVSESDKLHLLQCLGRASFNKGGTLGGAKKKENVFRYHSFCINGGEVTSPPGGEKPALQRGSRGALQKGSHATLLGGSRAALQKGSHAALQREGPASSQKLSAAKGTAKQWLRPQQRSVKLVPKKASPEGVRDAEKAAPEEGEEDDASKKLHPSPPLNAKDTPTQPHGCSQLHKKEQHTQAAPTCNDKMKRQRGDNLPPLQKNNSSRSMQISKGKKKKKDSFKNNYGVDLVPSAVHGKKSCPNLAPRGVNPSRAKTVQSAEWVKKTASRTREGLPTEAGLKPQRGRTLVGRPNLVGGHPSICSSCSSDSRSASHRSKNPKWGTPRGGGKKGRLPGDEQSRHTSNLHMQVDHSLENSLILTLSSSSSSPSPSPSSSSPSSSSNVISSVSSYHKEGRRRSSGAVRVHPRETGHAVKVNESISRVATPCEMDAQKEEMCRDEGAPANGGEPVRQDEPLGHPRRSDEESQAVRRKKGKGNSRGKGPKRGVPNGGKAGQLHPTGQVHPPKQLPHADRLPHADDVGPADEMRHIVRHKKAITKLKKKILNGVKRIRGEAALANRGGEFAQFVKRAKRALEERRTGSRPSTGKAASPEGRGESESHPRADTCELFVQENKNEALIRRYLNRQKQLMNHVNAYILFHQRKYLKECLRRRRGDKKSGVAFSLEGGQIDQGVVKGEVSPEEGEKNERRDQPGVEMKGGEVSPVISLPQGGDLQMVVPPLLREATRRSSQGGHLEEDSTAKQSFLAAHEGEENAKKEPQGKLKKNQMNLKDKDSAQASIPHHRAFEEKVIQVGSFSSQRVKQFLNGSDIKTEEVGRTDGWGALGRSSLCPPHFDTLSKRSSKVNAMRSGRMFLCSSEEKPLLQKSLRGEKPLNEKPLNEKPLRQNEAPREERLRAVRLKTGGEVRLAPNVRADLLDNCAAVFAFLRSQLKRVNWSLTGGHSTGGSRSFGGGHSTMGSRSFGSTSPTKGAPPKREDPQRDYLLSLRRSVKRHLEELRRTKIVAFILSVLPEKGSSPCTPTCNVKPVGRPHTAAMRVGRLHTSANHEKSPNWIAPHPVRRRVPTNVFSRRRRGKIRST